MKAERKKRMNLLKNKKYETDVLCAECMEISIGECENLYIESGYETVINNGVVTEFILKTENR
jgi:hypothetical protein